MEQRALQNISNISSIQALREKRKLPPKVQDILKQKWIGDVFDKIDGGLSLAKTQKYIKETYEYSIGMNNMSTLRQYREKMKLEDSSLDSFLTHKSPKELILSKSEAPKSNKDKLLRDVDFLDFFIQTANDQLRDTILSGGKIEPSAAFRAVELKHKIAGESMSGLTHYGIDYLQQITEFRYGNLMRIMYEYVERYAPRDQIEIMLAELDQADEDAYKQTEYYEEYLRSKGYSEEEIQLRVRLSEREQLDKSDPR